MKLHHVFVLIIALLLPLAVAPTATAATDPAISRAASWLKGQQQSGGSYLGFSGKADPGTTADIALALAAAGTDPATVANNGHSMTDYLSESAATYGTTVAGASKLTLAAVAAGLDPRSFGGQNLVQVMLSHIDPKTGLMDPQLYVHAYAILALSAAGQTVPAATVTALEQHQAADGGWAFTGETEAGKADSNTTAIVVQALVASGHGSSSTIPPAMKYLAGLQDAAGLYAYQPAAAGAPLLGDANSTALVIQALLATGNAVDSAAVAKPLAALDKMQNSSGALFFQQGTPADNLLATEQALPAFAGKALPIWPIHAPGRTLDEAKAPATAGDPQRCIFYQETGHNACNGFLAYWNHFGGVDSFGYPLTEEFTAVDAATGRTTTVQYFQRARFEWHPGSAPQRYDVQLGLLGSEQLAQP
ncbi:MAG TPA: prenyltransferase/squalene oxidase repeat-containing protein [Nitrolancea sp.]|nr:prenyltransferase/squalene oxidase repeat-containing protein [Nitrolancea sp.]